MKILNFVFALLFFLINSTAISQKIDIKGKILDKDNLKGIEDVNVLSVVNNSGTTSDKNGYFNLSLAKNLNDTIVFTHINYQKEIFIVPKDISDTIVIYLKKIVTNLNEVTVTATRSIFEDKNYNILDFSFLDKNLLLLKEDYNFNRLRSLILINDNFDTLNFSRNIPKKTKSIYKDCIGNLHIVTNDSAYQIIFLTNTDISFYQPIELKKFNLVLKNCLFETDSLIFFRNEIRAGFGEEYFTINKNDNSITTFLRVLDTSNLINYINNCSSISRKYWGHEIPAASVESDSILLDNIRSFEIEDRFLNDIATEKLSNKLISKNDTVIFFNNINSQIQIFSPKLESVKLIKTKYSKNNGWVGNIIKDEITNKTYTFYKTNGFCSIYEILVSDGSIQKIRDIPFIYPENIKINNGGIFFILNKMKGNRSFKKLIKIKI